MLGLRFAVFTLAAAVVACGGDDSVSFGSNPDAGSAGSSASGGASGAGASGGVGGAGGAGATGGASGSGQGGSAGSGQGGSAGAGGGTGNEDCTNGVDDDGDGQADCADANCQAGYACVSPPPIGWAAIGWLSSSDATCPSGFDLSTDLWESSAISAAPPTCTCSCGNPQGVSCATHLRCNSGSSCSTTGTVKGVSSGCTSFAVPNQLGTNSCSAEEPQAGGGNCEPQVSANAPPITWDATASACGSSSGGSCEDGTQTCVPRLPGGKGPCISQAGDVACPGAPYTQKTLYFDGQYSDSRSCETAGCNCASPQGGTCACVSSGTGPGCTVQVYLSNSCNSANVASVLADNTSCETFSDVGNFDASWGIRLTGTAVSNAGSCAASGAGTPAGEVEPTGPITVCCAP